MVEHILREFLNTLESEQLVVKAKQLRMRPRRPTRDSTLNRYKKASSVRQPGRSPVNMDLLPHGRFNFELLSFKQMNLMIPMIVFPRRWHPGA